MSATDFPPLSGALGRLGLVTDEAAHEPEHGTVPRPARSSAVVTDVDWQLVVSLRREAAELIGRASAEWLESRGRPIPEADRRTSGQRCSRSAVQANSRASNQACRPCGEARRMSASLTPMVSRNSLSAMRNPSAIMFLPSPPRPSGDRSARSVAPLTTN